VDARRRRALCGRRRTLHAVSFVQAEVAKLKRADERRTAAEAPLAKQVDEIKVRPPVNPEAVDPQPVPPSALTSPADSSLLMPLCAAGSAHQAELVSGGTARRRADHNARRG
jgi:hypothetical protein